MVLTPGEEYQFIRQLTPSDLEQLQQWDHDPEITALNGKKFQKDHDSEQLWWEDLLTSRVRIGFAIIADWRLIGDVELEHISWRSHHAELRISIGDKSYWNRGIGTLAVGEVLDIAYYQLGLRRIYLRVNTDNHRAIRAYEKAGFKKVAKLVANGRLKGNTDLLLMECLFDQYVALKA
ncbi:MAG: N-acetyltransferase [Sulfobacillus thermosulfidooxidans]|uniref:N-acetyltransferase domain-containing protein n=1 Tax=Sulfobacillus thermotolerans TaxID=338644 RepID=A0ABM6RP61_9FIRM|nr:GNAT family N-acetyltransferase [Sulfobacillus sp. hq2]AUW93152.1 hypothetical protein BXT84_03625 [Sulfobacillus thermotolerans]MCY0908837.1 GNAT family N-acetyltransferase [Sulfobacillus thermotolerans]POB10048.1 GNAT family N-acetyltransferase [Sulfobacillus sp. hq2]PSR37604.1 MAG: N-acetyltransferase [Sulfobacillus thermosulfidooxidans]